METHIAELQQRRALLAERAEAQRMELSAVCQEFEQPLRWVTVVGRVAAFLRNSPAFGAFSTAASVLIGPRLASIRDWLPRGLMLYRLASDIRHKWREHKLRKSIQVETAT